VPARPGPRSDPCPALASTLTRSRGGLLRAGTGDRSTGKPPAECVPGRALGQGSPLGPQRASPSPFSHHHPSPHHQILARTIAVAARRGRVPETRGRVVVPRRRGEAPGPRGDPSGQARVPQRPLLKVSGSIDPLSPRGADRRAISSARRRARTRWVAPRSSLAAPGAWSPPPVDRITGSPFWVWGRALPDRHSL